MDLNHEQVRMLEVEATLQLTSQAIESEYEEKLQIAGAFK